MTRYRTVRLALHLGRHQCHYALVLRTVDGKSTTDRRLSWGQLPLPTDQDDPSDVLGLLQRAVWDLGRRHGLTPGAAGPGAPGGGGGRPTDDDEQTMPLFLISRDGQTLDTDGSAD